MKKILYLFTGGRQTRLAQWQQGVDTPLEFLYGVPYLQQQEYQVDILELNDLHPDTKSSEYQELYRRNTHIQQQYLLTPKSQFLIGATEQLNAYDVIIASDESTAFAAAHFIRQGRVRTPLIYFVMGMLSYLPTLKTLAPEWKGVLRLPDYLYQRVYHTRFRQGKRIYQELIQASRHVLFLGQGEYRYARQEFPAVEEKFSFLPFAIDTNFWIPAAPISAQSPYILFMGNDRQRDFDLVVKIASSLPQFHFKFITRGIRPEFVPPNAELLIGDWKEQFFSDSEIRSFIRNSTMVMLPLKDTIKPSGQSVALQAMACGKPVVISNTCGFWEPATFVDHEHLCFVHGQTVEAWRQILERLMQNQHFMLTLGRNARCLVEQNNNLEQFGRRLEAVLLQCSAV